MLRANSQKPKDDIFVRRSAETTFAQHELPGARAPAAIAAVLGILCAAGLPVGAHAQTAPAQTGAFVTIVDACSLNSPQLNKRTPVRCGGSEVSSSVSVRQSAATRHDPAASTRASSKLPATAYIVILE